MCVRAVRGDKSVDKVSAKDLGLAKSPASLSRVARKKSNASKPQITFPNIVLSLVSLRSDRPGTLSSCLSKRRAPQWEFEMLRKGYCWKQKQQGGG